MPDNVISAITITRTFISNEIRQSSSMKAFLVSIVEGITEPCAHLLDRHSPLVDEFISETGVIGSSPCSSWSSSWACQLAVLILCYKLNPFS